VKLYYNNNLASQKLSDQPTLEENLIMRLQNNIYNSKQGNAPKKGIEQQNLQNAEFIMLITETTDMNSFSFAKTISELFEPITNDKMQFVFDPQTLPPGFTELGHTKLEQCYESLHPQLMALQGKQSEVRSENKHDSKHEINREMSKSKFKPVISIKKPETHEIKEKIKTPELGSKLETIFKPIPLLQQKKNLLFVKSLVKNKNQFQMLRRRIHQQNHRILLL